MNPLQNVLFAGDSNSEDEEIGSLLGFTLMGIDEADAICRRRRTVTRQYLTRPQLLPNPRYGTPWMTLYVSRDDRAYVTTMGTDVASFDYILNFFAVEWNTTPIPREGVRANTEPRIGGRSLDAAGGLGLLLQYLSSSVYYTSLEHFLR
jgi:hypothetical protein